MTLNIPQDALNHDQEITLRVVGCDGPLLPPHQVLLSPVVILGPSSIQGCQYNLEFFLRLSFKFVHALIVN